MLSLLQRVSIPPPVARPCLRVHLASTTRRTIVSTPARPSTFSPEPPTAEEEEELEAASPQPLAKVVTHENVEEALEDDEAEEGSVGGEPKSYKEFLSTIGAKYKLAAPRNWLGGDIPFPMNPSFKPPPPLSDVLRQQIYNKFMENPQKNTIRALSQQYHLSLKRVDAILRLKGLEHAWYKDKQIQYGFQKGMEKLLGVQSHKAEQALKDGSRWDVAEADSLEQDENRDAQRQRYQRHYWESVPEDGQEPIIPASLEHAKNLAQKLVKFEEHQKSTHPRLMPRFPDTQHIKTPKQKVRLLEKSGRPTIEVRDVGGKFLDLTDRLKRIATAERRAREKEKKREKKRETIRATKAL